MVARAQRLARRFHRQGRLCHWNGIGGKTKRLAAVVRVRGVAPLPPRSFGARRPPLGQGEVIRSVLAMVVGGG